jgi:crossover junction endodeoxyribonuclease RuvC
MFALGIDPGLSRCGYGLVGRGQTDGVLRARAAGVLETDPAAPVAARLLVLHSELTALLRELEPDVVVVERVFFQVNAKTAMAVGQASGLALLAAAAAGCEVTQYTANEVKLGLVGYGAATKEQVQRMVAQVLGLAAVGGPADVADALALAICHLTTVSVRRAVEAALGEDAVLGADTARHGGIDAERDTDAETADRRTGMVQTPTRGVVKRSGA